MVTFNSETYKDDPPARTIERIRRMLDELGILMVEQWFESIGLYSVRLTVHGTSVGQNGKGVTQELALASAYAEVMERLQNQLMFPFAELAPEAVAHGGFFFAPDEQPMTIDEVLSSDDQFVRSMIDGQTDDGDESDTGDVLTDMMRQWLRGENARDRRRRAAERWMRVGRLSGCEWDFVGVPFYDVNRDALTKIPCQMVRTACLSNGTCAGNTPAEAIVQGLSEVLERKALHEIMWGGMVPPTVPRDYVSRFPAVDETIGRLEKDHGYAVTVKDCSMGWGYPIVGVILTNRRRNAYAVRLGAHASFDIALERCLTEVFQGRTVGEILDRDMTTFDFTDTRSESSRNCNSLYRIGRGCYPRTFFSSNDSYPFRELPDTAGATNRERLRHLASLIIGKGYSILVRDASFLGFPSYHVLVPGMSELFHLFDRHRLKFSSSLRDIATTMRNVNGSAEPELKQLALYMIERLGWVKECDTVPQLLGFPTNRRFPWRRTDPWVFTAMMQWRLGRATGAHGTISGYVEYLVRENQTEELAYYRCVRDWLGAAAAGMDRQEAAKMLAAFHAADVLDRVVDRWGSPDRVLKDFTALPCYDCQKCQLRDGCLQEQFRDMHIRLKERMKRNPLDQTALRSVFGLS